MKAIIIGGRGQIGRAIAKRFVSGGWEVDAIVTAADRGGSLPMPDKVKLVVVDRESTRSLTRAIGSGADVLVDTVAFDEKHARQLLRFQSVVGSFAVLSSIMVYADDRGHTIDAVTDSPDHPFPTYPVGITESQRTALPGPERYSTRKAALEHALLSKSKVPAALVRPGAVYGLGSRHPREWWFVKRVLDRRRRVALCYGGRSRFHTVSVDNVAEVVHAAVRARYHGCVNAGDPEALTVRQIGREVAKVFGHRFAITSFGGDPQAGDVGATPWSVKRPVVLDMQLAASFGYRPVSRYAEAVGAYCWWLVAAAIERGWLEAFPVLGQYRPTELFDYAAEDEWFARRGTAKAGR
ncbi:MAG: NAD-dependent epimerase/dehydratase family protein [Candidatus Eremiobacteraeota bacterium]|nr:NAD-dependent epimerase/dehydratase family protein [Candidatus Eremiobacteraeota bacterium]